MQVSEVRHMFIAVPKEAGELDLLAQAFNWLHEVEIVASKDIVTELKGIGVDAIDVASFTNFDEIVPSIDFIVVDLDAPEIMNDPLVRALLNVADREPGRVAIICDPEDYQIIIAEMSQFQGSLSQERLGFLITKARKHEVLCENPAMSLRA